MMDQQHQQTLTKSIDVGGIFLMDLSVNESDTTTNHINYQQSSDKLTMGARSDASTSFIAYYQNRNAGLEVTHRTNNSNSNSASSSKGSGSSTSGSSSSSSGSSSSIAEAYRPPRQQDLRADRAIGRQPNYLGSSLDRLASAINYSEQRDPAPSLGNNYDEEPLANMAELQQARGRRQCDHNLYDGPGEPARPSFSFSDESFDSSSDASLSASFTGCSEDDEEDGCDKASTTTREDSGVLDMKDLEGQLNSCNSFEDKNHKPSSNILYSSDNNHSAGKPISVSTNIVAKNLISANKKTTRHLRHSKNESASNDAQSNIDRSGKPTKNANRNGIDESGQQSYHQLQSSQLSAKRRVSASVPIQVPARQMRKDLNKMKLNLLKEEHAIEQELALGFQDGVKQTDMASKKNQDLALFEDDDAFLEQEYNTNHHNHYPINDHGDENLTAGNDPMKLFASIQALARSLHDDAEIFGSLPPKRTLESPIRSMALV